LGGDVKVRNALLLDGNASGTCERMTRRKRIISRLKETKKIIVTHLELCTR